MIKKYFLLLNNVVENIILLDENDIASHLSRLGVGYTLVELIRDNSGMSIGDIYDPNDETWTSPAPVVVPAPRILTKLGFRGVFTITELMDIDNYETSTLPANDKRTVKTILANFGAASEIDLDNPLTAQGLGVLESLGLIGAGRTVIIMAN